MIMNGLPAIPSGEDLNLLSDIVKRVTRIRRVPTQDTEDFAQSVQVWLLERNYDVFHRFAGRSSLRTYLTVVVHRLLLDWRNSIYGKWRASAAARRLGDDAVMLERLIHRDGYPAGDAIERLRRERGATPSRLLDVLEQLPARARRVRVSDDALVNVAAPGAEDVMEAAERRRDERRIRRAIAVGLRQLTDEDRWLIHARYEHGRSVQSLARALKVDPKLLYRRCERVLKRLRIAVHTVSVAADQPRHAHRPRNLSSASVQPRFLASPRGWSLPSPEYRAARTSRD